MRWFLLLLLLGCSNVEPTSFQGQASDIPYRVLIGSSLTPQEHQKIHSLLHAVFEKIDAHCNDYNPRSEIAKINALQAGKKIELSPLLATLLKETDRLVALSHGKFDPTVGPLTHLWKERLRLGRLPATEEIEPLLPAVGWEHIHLEGNILWKDHALTTLDLGGIEKGYGIDLIAEELLSFGFTSFFIEWGGEVRVQGRHPTGRKWRIGVAGQTIELENEAIATSGDTFQSWVVEGHTYTHFINPLTKAPLIDPPLHSVSYIAPTCTEADALTKSLLFSNYSRCEDCRFANLK